MKERRGSALGTWAVGFVLLLGFVLGGFCVVYWFPTHPPVRVPRVSLLDLLKPMEEASPASPAEFLKYDFRRGLGDWSIIRGDQTVSLGRKGLKVHNGAGEGDDESPRVSTVLSVEGLSFDADRVTDIEITMRLDPGDFRPVLGWVSTPAGSSEKKLGECRVSVSQGEMTTVTIPVSEDPDWRGKISSLTLMPVPIPGVSVEIARVRLICRPSVPRRSRCEVGPMTVDAIVGRVPFSVAGRGIEIVSSLSGIRFDVGCRGGRGASFRVQLFASESGDEERVVLDETVRPDEPSSIRSFQLPLDWIAGGSKVDLRFEFGEASGGGVPSGPVEAVLIAPALEYRVRKWKKPNVILISLDTLRADHLGCYGYDRGTSPFLDRIASRSSVFEEAVSQAPETLASTMTMLTGRYPSNHGVYRAAHRLCDETAMLSFHLSRAGYRTAGFVEGGFVDASYGFDLGFDLYHNGIRPAKDAGGDVVNTFARARQWLTDNDDRPFFLFLQTYEIHTPYAPPSEFKNRFVDHEYDGILKEQVFNDELARNLLDENFPEKLTPRDREYAIALYDAEIAYVDSVLEDFFLFLGERGRLRDTLVVITSDHGDDLGDYNAVGIHGHTLHRAVSQVPLIVYGWALSGDTRILPQRLKQRVGVIDIAPTILDIIGVDDKVREPMQGISLGRRLVEGDAGVADERRLYCQDLTNFVRTAVFSGDHKYVKTYGYERHRGELAKRHRPGLFWFFTGYRTNRLVDLERDPNERTNLFGVEPDRDAEMVELVTRFRAWMSTASRPERCAADIDEEEKMRLQALGYAEEVADLENTGDVFDLVTNEERGISE